jgi:hypothetical protein
VTSLVLGGLNTRVLNTKCEKTLKISIVPMLLRPTLSKVFEPTLVGVEPKQSIAEFKVSMQTSWAKT